MRLDERPAIDQLLDPEPVIYCAGCGQPKPCATDGCGLWREGDG